MHQDDPFVTPMQPRHGTFAPWRRTMVNDQKQPFRVAVRFLIQYLRHHAPKRPNARSPFATAHHDAAMHVPGCQVLQGALAFIFRFDASRSTPPWRLLWVPALPCLDARLLIT